MAKRAQLPFFRVSATELLRNDLVSVDLLNTATQSCQWLRGPLFPVGEAADHKMLYVLVRALCEHHISCSVEMGVGQTTGVLDAYAAATGASVLSLEHDTEWAERFKDRCVAPSHLLSVGPLSSFNGAFVRQYEWYSAERHLEKLSEKVELFVVDGPPGVSRYSRVGIVERFLTLAADNFLLLWDDVDRLGDFESFALLYRTLRNQGRGCHVHFYRGVKSLGVLFTEGFDKVQSYF